MHLLFHAYPIHTSMHTCTLRAEIPSYITYMHTYTNIQTDLMDAPTEHIDL